MFIFFSQFWFDPIILFVLDSQFIYLTVTWDLYFVGSFQEEFSQVQGLDFSRPFSCLG